MNHTHTLQQQATHTHTHSQNTAATASIVALMSTLKISTSAKRPGTQFCLKNLLTVSVGAKQRSPANGSLEKLLENYPPPSPPVSCRDLGGAARRDL